MNMNPQDETLAAAIARHGIDLPPERTVVLERYCAALWDWNTKLNLTRHTDYDTFVARDLIDSLALAQQLSSGEKVLDVGSGGGVPGVVLAVLRPEVKVTLSESVGKKARALEEIVRQAGLELPVHHGRAEILLAAERFDTLVIRAVGRLKKLLGWFSPHWDRFDRMLIVKGPGWVEERGEARHYGLLAGLDLRRLDAYPMPGTGAESVVLQINRKGR